MLKSKLIPLDRFESCYDLFETTSASVPVLATIDATRRPFAEDGQRLLGKLLEDARWIREKLTGIRGIQVMGKQVATGDARFAMEEMKIYFNVSDLGVNGYEAEDWLMAEHSMRWPYWTSAPCSRHSRLATTADRAANW
jgi:arginine decarboxylase